MIVKVWSVWVGGKFSWLGMIKFISGYGMGFFC